MKTSMHRSTLAALFLVMLALFGCRSRDYSGNWKGTTSQGNEISFTVKDNAVVSAAAKYKLDCRTSGFCPVEGSFNGDIDSSVKIEADAFSAKIDGNRITMTGTFSPEMSSSGELKVFAQDNSRCDCSANIKWTAKKL